LGRAGQPCHQAIAVGGSQDNIVGAADDAADAVVRRAASVL
jgi:hypothetical protein